MRPKKHQTNAARDAVRGQKGEGRCAARSAEMSITQVKDFAPGGRSRRDPAAAFSARPAADASQPMSALQLRDLVVIQVQWKARGFRPRQAGTLGGRISMQKRPVEPERIDQMISGIVRRLESMGETDIPSKLIGGDRDGTSGRDRHRSLRPFRKRLQELPGNGRLRGISWRSSDRRFRPAPRPWGPTPIGGSWRSRCRWDAAGWAVSGRTRRWACVIVKEGRVVGRGWTQDGGRPPCRARGAGSGRCGG